MGISDWGHAVLRLYGAARSRAVRNIWMLNELGLDYETYGLIAAFAGNQDTGLSSSEQQRRCAGSG